MCWKESVRGCASSVSLNMNTLHVFFSSFSPPLLTFISLNKPPLSGAVDWTFNISFNFYDSVRIYSTKKSKKFKKFWITRIPSKLDMQRKAEFKTNKHHNRFQISTINHLQKSSKKINKNKTKKAYTQPQYLKLINLASFQKSQNFWNSILSKIT